MPNEDCCVCLDVKLCHKVTPVAKLTCGHRFCKACIRRLLKDNPAPTCPMCRAVPTCCTTVFRNRISYQRIRTAAVAKRLPPPPPSPSPEWPAEAAAVAEDDDENYSRRDFYGDPPTDSDEEDERPQLVYYHS